MLQMKEEKTLNITLKILSDQIAAISFDDLVPYTQNE